MLHAKHVGVTICVENTTSEMGDPAYLRAFYDETRLAGLRFNFDIGHAHLADGPEEERVEKGFAPMRELISGVHVHDNHGEKDEHLPPYDGTIDWAAAIKLLKTAPEAIAALPSVTPDNTPPLQAEAIPDAPDRTSVLAVPLYQDLNSCKQCEVNLDATAKNRCRD